jgi:hypothetical protein
MRHIDLMMYHFLDQRSGRECSARSAQFAEAIGSYRRRFRTKIIYAEQRRPRMRWRRALQGTQAFRTA